MREGFSLTLEELTSRCFVVELSEYSGTWTPRSLRALDDLQERLMKASDRTAQLLVRAKPEQNWPMQKTAPDREMPNHVEELCARMGLEDPRTQADQQYDSISSQKRP